MLKMVIVSILGLILFGALPVARAAEKHLIYMQGCCVQQANGAVARDYKTIVQTLRDAGFNVFFELRTADETDKEGQAQAYAEKIRNTYRACWLKVWRLKILLSADSRWGHVPR